MSSAHPLFTARSEGLPETIFDLIADMPVADCPVPRRSGGQRRFLSGRLGTTYLDAKPAGQRPGSVTGFTKLVGNKNTTQEESWLVK